MLETQGLRKNTHMFPQAAHAGVGSPDRGVGPDGSPSKAHTCDNIPRTQKEVGSAAVRLGSPAPGFRFGLAH